MSQNLSTTDQDIQDLKEVAESTESVDPKTQMEQNIKVMTFQHKAMKAMISKHVQNFGAVMVSTKGTSYQEKLNALFALEAGILTALDFGVNDVKLPAAGVKWSKELNNFVQCFVKAMESQQVVMAYKNLLKEGEKNAEQTSNESTGLSTSESSKTSSNGSGETGITNESSTTSV